MKSFFKFISFVLVLAAVAGGVYLVMKNQETRRGATANATSTSVLPANVSTKTGDNFNVHVWVNTGANTDKLVGAEFIVKFDPSLIKYVSSNVVANNYQILNEVSADNGELEFKIVSMSGEKSGAIDLVKLNFKSLGGAGKIEVKTGGKMMISGQSNMWDIATNNLMNYSTANTTTTPTTSVTPTTTVTPTATTTQQNQMFTFNAGSTAISVGSSTTLTWTLSSGSTLTCTKDGDWNGKTNVSGSQVVTPKSTSTYSLSCKKSDQRATKISVTVKVVKLPTLTLKASKNNIQSGKSTKLSWDVSGSAVTCTKSVGWTGTVTDSGNKYVSPTTTTTYSMVCANAAGSSSVKSVTITVQGGNEITPTPTGVGNSGVTPTPTPDGINYLLNYKMSFGNISAANAKCLVDWPFKISVLSNGSSKTFTGILPQFKTVVDNKLIFNGTLTLSGFNQNNNVAVFVSGPQHLQMKYGKDLQTSAYNQAGGSLTLTKTNSPVYDFSGYPLAPGDVVSNTSQDEQDGIINAVDYAYVKSRSITHLTVDEGEFLKGDLNGDCQVNSGDIIVIKSSLQERQGQLY
jgi:hypothetical protein